MSHMISIPNHEIVLGRQKIVKSMFLRRQVYKSYRVKLKIVYYFLIKIIIYSIYKNKLIIIYNYLTRCHKISADVLG